MVKDFPCVLVAIFVKGLIVWMGVFGSALKLVVNVGAALYLALPAWFAARTTTPAEVTVTILPLTVAGPETTERVTGNPDVDLGSVTANGVQG